MQDWIGALVDSPPISWQMAGCKRGHYEGPEYCERCGQDIPREFVCDEWDEAKRAVHQKQMQQYWGANRITFTFGGTTDGTESPPEGQKRP